jgi:hypothetical protein
LELGLVLEVHLSQYLLHRLMEPMVPELAQVVLVEN